MKIPTRAETIRKAKTAGLKIVAVMPIYYPRELFRACGFHPVELWGPPGVNPAEGAAHLQAYTCAIVRNATAFLLQGKLEVADALLIPHTCDALQGMGSVLIDFLRPKLPVHTLYHPRNPLPSGRRFLVTELRRLAEELTKASGKKVSERELLEAVELEVEADRAFARLIEQRMQLALSDRAFYNLLRSREYLSAEDFIELAKSAPKGDPPGYGVPLMISGIVPEPMDIFDTINDAGARVVVDDLACCSRRLYPTSGGDNPYEWMAERLIGAPPDPTRGFPIPDRARYLAQRLSSTGAKGVLVYDVKFCEPELFDLPYLKDYLSGQGYPLLHVEFDMSETISQQTQTRIEAFVETLR